MAAFGYGNVPDRAFVAFERELDEGAWKDVATKKFDELAKESASALLTAPQPVIWKIRLRSGLAAVVAALGAPSLTLLDKAWDAAQRRLFHRMAAGVDAEDRDERDAADRLRAGLLAGTGTAQTQLDFNAEVDFGRQQIKLTREGGHLAEGAKKLKLSPVLAAVAKATEALAKGLGRSSGEKRKPPSRQLRDAPAAGCRTIDGLDMQLAQAVRHCRLWTAVIPEAPVHRDADEKRLLALAQLVSV